MVIFGFDVRLSCLLVLFFSLFVQKISAETFYICQKSNGVQHITNVPSDCGVSLRIKRLGKSVPASTTYESYDNFIQSSSDRYGLDPQLVKAVIKVESDFQSLARSRKGAQGLMQLMPDTARLHNVKDAYDPGENIEGGVRHLKYLLGYFKEDLELALAAYNAGIKAVEKYKGVPPFVETRDYITRVLSIYRRYTASN